MNERPPHRICFLMARLALYLAIWVVCIVELGLTSARLGYMSWHNGIIVFLLVITAITFLWVLTAASILGVQEHCKEMPCRRRLGVARWVVETICLHIIWALWLVGVALMTHATAEKELQPWRGNLHKVKSLHVGITVFAHFMWILLSVAILLWHIEHRRAVESLVESLGPGGYIALPTDTDDHLVITAAPTSASASQE